MSKETDMIYLRIQQLGKSIGNENDLLKARLREVESQLEEYKIKQPIDYSSQILKIQRMQVLINDKLRVIEDRTTKMKEEMLKIVDNLTQQLQAEVIEPELECEHKMRFDMLHNKLIPIPDKVQQQQAEQLKKEQIDTEIQKMDGDIQDIIDSKLEKKPQEKKPEASTQDETKTQLELQKKKHERLQENAKKALDLIKEQKEVIEKQEAEMQLKQQFIEKQKRTIDELGQKKQEKSVDDDKTTKGDD